ncbi:MAG: nitroreductase family deazaflavin-dependent oxidoreductase [Solirubrobacterales bacterium]|nr:nitroreductase family deazaflavin-dependent oxidoreductase [Solirubrobacterales bacterium]
MLFGSEHVERYVATGGTEGHEWQGTRCLLLMTTGRKSGEQRVAPLIYGRLGDDYLVVASKGGAPDHPGWYKNLAARPRVRVQVLDQVFEAEAHDAEGAEREQAWAIMVKEWPSYEEYQAKTERQIPVVVLRRV